MDADAFRSLALALPEVEEGSHHGHPDFRIAGKVLATLGPDADWAMVKLPPDVQQLLVDGDGEVFAPMPGAWGRQGCTRVELERADPAIVERALSDAWLKVAPPRVKRRHPERD